VLERVAEGTFFATCCFDSQCHLKIGRRIVCCTCLLCSRTRTSCTATQHRLLGTALSARLAPSIASATMTSFRDRDATRGAVASTCCANLCLKTETITARHTTCYQPTAHKYLRHLSCNSFHQTNHLNQTHQTAFDIARPKQPDPPNPLLEPERPPSPTRSLLHNTDEMISAIILVIITIFRMSLTIPLNSVPN
jgi:hypothetical protein